MKFVNSLNAFFKNIERAVNRDGYKSFAVILSIALLATLAIGFTIMILIVYPKTVLITLLTVTLSFLTYVGIKG